VRVWLVLASITIAAELSGCAAPANHNHLARPSFDEQVRTREIRVVSSPEEPTLPWKADAGRQGALAEALVTAGAANPHVRFGIALAGADWAPTYVVGVSEVRWIGGRGPDRPVFLAASVFARRSDRAAIPPVPSLVVHLTDPTPRTREEWLADGARAARAALTGLTEVGASELVAELTSVLGALAVPPGGYCGLTPSEELLLLEASDAPTVVRWMPFEIEGQGDELRVTYEVRVWRFDGAGPTLVVERTGLAEPAVEVSLTPGVEHGLSARARIDLGGERSWATPWSARARKGDLCARKVGPLETLRKLVWARDGDDVAPPAERPAPPPASAPIALAAKAGSMSVRIAGEHPSVVVEPPANLSAGPRGVPPGARRAVGRAAGGAVAGAAYGLVRSVECGFLAPFCAPWSVAFGAIAGGAEAATTERNPYRPQVTYGAASDYLRELNWALGTVAREPAVREALVESIRSAQPGETSSTAPTLELEWTRVAFREVTIDETGPAVTLEVGLAATLRQEGTAPQRRSVAVLGPGPLPRTFWVGDDRALLRGAVRAQLARAARQLLAEFGVVAAAGP
jgi:hypothetical protein